MVHVYKCAEQKLSQDVEDKLVVMAGKVINWEVGIDIYTLLCRQ